MTTNAINVPPDPSLVNGRIPGSPEKPIDAATKIDRPTPPKATT